MGADPEKPAILKKDEVACGKLLLCDISVKNIEDEICTVGDISLVYDINGVCQLLGYPVYFSNAKDNEHGIYDYTLVQGQSLDAQIGFCVDHAFLQINNKKLKIRGRVASSSPPSLRISSIRNAFSRLRE